MTFAFYLKDKNRREGTPLVLIVSHANRKYKKQFGISVRPADWRKQRTKDESVNQKLRTIENVLNERLNQFSTPAEIKDAIDAALEAAGRAKPKRSAARPTFWEHFREWADRDTASRKDRDLACRRVSEIMGADDDWEQIDEAWCIRFVRKCDGLKFSDNYKATLIAKVKSVLIDGRKLGYHNSDEYKKFKYRWETADTVALTMAEVDALWNADLSGRDAMARDLFILGVYTAARFQNYSRLTKRNIVGGMIQFVQPKTGGTVLIPVSPRVRAVLKRNGGEAPKMTEQELGRRIKEICKGIGGSFLDTYDIRRTKGGRVQIERKAKWEKISSHTARRTGLTILCLEYKVPLRQLMAVSGHKTVQNLMKYLKLTEKENATLLSGVAFFK